MRIGVKLIDDVFLEEKNLRYSHYLEWNILLEALSILMPWVK